MIEEKEPTNKELFDRVIRAFKRGIVTEQEMDDRALELGYTLKDVENALNGVPH